MDSIRIVKEFFRLHYPEKGEEEELSVYFRVDFYFILFYFYFLVLNMRIVQRRVELDF